MIIVFIRTMIITPTYKFSIAKRDKARIVPTGVYALNALGFSTQIPMNVVFLTDGAARKIKVGNGQGIVFKRTVAKNLSYKNDVSLIS